MRAEFSPNQCISMAKGTSQHNEIQAKIKTAKKTNILHLSSLNLDLILPETFLLTNLVRLDLSFNNLVKLDPQIGKLLNLQILWVNDNPLRELPLELALCTKLKEVDLRNTFIITLPRELASLSGLFYLNLDGCPLKDSLQATYSEGMASMQKMFRHKDDRRVYKDKLLSKLTEWIYPSVDKNLVGEMVEQVFEALKGYDSAILKKLYRDCHVIFPLKFEQVDPENIKEKLIKVFEETKEREEISALELKIRAHFIKEPLAVIVKLATDIYRSGLSEHLEEYLKYGTKVFSGVFAELTGAKLKQNLEDYKKSKVEERKMAIVKLKKRIAHLYKDEKLDEKVTDNYAVCIVSFLGKTKNILEFNEAYKGFMPKGHELKYFDAKKIVESFMATKSE